LELNLAEAHIVAKHRNRDFSEQLRQEYRTVPMFEGSTAATGRVRRRDRAGRGIARSGSRRAYLAPWSWTRFLSRHPPNLAWLAERGFSMRAIGASPSRIKIVANVEGLE